MQRKLHLTVYPRLLSRSENYSHIDSERNFMKLVIINQYITT